jgi:hypothetical protein
MHVDMQCIHPLPFFCCNALLDRLPTRPCQVQHACHAPVAQLDQSTRLRIWGSEVRILSGAPELEVKSMT